MKKIKWVCIYLRFLELSQHSLHRWANSKWPQSFTPKSLLNLAYLVLFRHISNSSTAWKQGTCFWSRWTLQTKSHLISIFHKEDLKNWQQYQQKVLPVTAAHPTGQRWSSRKAREEKRGCRSECFDALTARVQSDTNWNKSLITWDTACSGSDVSTKFHLLLSWETYPDCPNKDQHSSNKNWM